MDLNDKRQELGRLVQQARDINDKAGKEKRSLTADENTNYENLDKEIERLEGEIKREEKLQAREADLAKEKREKGKEKKGNGEDDRPEDADKPLRERAAYRQAFNNYLRGGLGLLDARQMEMAASEVRALQADADVQGGYMVTPVETVNQLIKAVDNMVFIRQKATKLSVPSAQSLGAPSLDADPDDFDWTSELATGSEDSAMAFGKRELHPHPLAKRIKLSNKILRMVPDVEGLVRGRLSYKVGITQEKGFLTGSGAQQPLGVFTANAQGISTGRDVATDNTATAMTADGLMNAFYSLKEPYQKAADWLFHRDGVKQIRKMKDGNGNYLWQPGLSGGQPATILDRPYSMSEYAPNTFTTGLYVGIVGDFSFYWIADALDMTIQRLVELYAETNQVGLIGRLECDGMPVLEEAFARVKLG